MRLGMLEWAKIIEFQPEMSFLSLNFALPKT